MKTIKINSSSEIPENFTGIVEYPDKTKYWFKNGKQHRENGPAVENSNGYKEWIKDGIPHREDGPAIEHVNGSKSWFKDGKRHRENGPAYESISGYKEWHLEGKEYVPKNLKDFVVLDHYKGKYGIMWHRLLDKDEILDYPDIPGLIVKE